jgi:hypothetical protein
MGIEANWVALFESVRSGFVWSGIVFLPATCMRPPFSYSIIYFKKTASKKRLLMLSLLCRAPLTVLVFDRRHHGLVN